MYTTTTNDARVRRMKAEAERERRLSQQGVTTHKPGNPAMIHAMAPAR